MTKKTPELLLPAGSFEKMQAAFHFGADAVYLSGRKFGMRSAAVNFSDDEIDRAVRYAHELNKKVYVTVNTMPREYELSELKAALETLRDINPDALIVADPGVLRLSRRIAPLIPLHLSTQATTVNSEAVRFWADLGVKRIVLARELTLDEIKAIRRETPETVELEAFVHGSMCVSYSGRCLLSEYYTGRDANRGACAQPCRWVYHFAENSRPGEIMTGEIHPEGTYLFGSKDLCLIGKLDELSNAGIQSFKIEGRMKSAYYAAVTANAYRMALDHADVSVEKLMAELNSVSHREYCTGFYFDAQDQKIAATPGYMHEKQYLADVIEALSDKRYLCRQKNKFMICDSVEVLTPGKCGKSVEISGLFSENGTPIDACPHPQMLFIVETKTSMKAGDILRKA